MEDKEKVEAERLDRPDREKIAQEFYGIFMNDPSNNHLENKEWSLLVEARKRADQILALKPTEEEIRKKLVTAYQKIIGTLNERNAKRLGDARKAVAEEIKNMKLPLTYIKGVLRPDGRPLHPAIDKSGEEVQQDLLKAILDKLRGR